MRLRFGREPRAPLGEPGFRRRLRILLIRPIGWGEDTQEGPFREHRRAGLLRSTRVDLIYCAGAPRVIDDDASRDAAAPHVVAKARWGEAHGYDAIAVGCMLDPGVEEARKAVRIPVVGAREAASALAALVGGRATFVVPAGVGVLELEDDPERTYRALVAASREQLRREGAGVVVPGCTLLGGLAQRLGAELGVPALPNEEIALKLAELLAGFQVLPERAPRPDRG